MKEIWKHPGFSMPSYSLTNFELQKFCQCKPKFNGNYSVYGLSKTNDEAYVKSLDKYKSIGTH